MKRYEEIYQELINKGLEDKYKHPGIYSIHIDDKLVYIGQSKEMLLRIANHLSEMETSSSNKYKVLRTARESGHTIIFDVVEYCQVGELDQLEAKYINQLWPPLNYQIPNIGSSGFTVNKEAKYITLKSILSPQSPVYDFK